MLSLLGQGVSLFGNFEKEKTLQINDSISSDTLLLRIIVSCRATAQVYVSDFRLDEAVRYDDPKAALAIIRSTTFNWEAMNWIEDCLRQALDIVVTPVRFESYEAELEAEWRELKRLTIILRKFVNLMCEHMDEFM